MNAPLHAQGEAGTDVAVEQYDQATALMRHIGEAFPPWRIWRAGDIWYATGPCRISDCSCSRTLHAPDPVGLCRQLDEVEQGGRAQRGDRELTIEEAYLLVAGLSWAREGEAR